MRSKQKIISSLICVLAALIWGVAFVAQSKAVETIGTFTFNATRFFIGGTVLLPVIFIMDRTANVKKVFFNKTLIIGGILCGIVLTVSSSLQQYGLMLGASAGKAGFITALYIIIVPIIGTFMKKKTSGVVWVGAVIAIFGMYLLCVADAVGAHSDGSIISKSEIILFLCAIGFSFHILVIDKYSPLVSGVKLSCIQFFVAGMICMILALIFENNSFKDLLNAAIPILYAGVMSCGVAYTLQIVGQKNLNPALASLLFSLESVFAAIAGFFLLDEKLTKNEIIGCTLVFAAIILVQIPLPKKNKKSKAVQ